MAYSLPLWRSADAADYGTPPQYYPEPTGWVEPTDAKRWLTQYASTLPGFNDAWRPYLPAIAGFYEGKIQNPEAYLPEGMWDDMTGWYNALPSTQYIAPWATANPLGNLPEGSYNWMSSNWWQPGQGGVNTYTPPPPPPAYDPKAGHRTNILDNIMEQGVMGRTSPGGSGFGVTPLQAKIIEPFEQPMQQFSVLNQFNTMPKWDMGAGPNWTGI